MTIATIVYSSKLDVEVCVNCGCTFALPQDLHQDLRKSGRNFFCPVGHSMSYGESAASKLQKQLAEAETLAARRLTQLTQEQEQREATQRELDKAKRRISGGSCPCCKRNFKALHRHMAAKHPDYKA